MEAGLKIHIESTRKVVQIIINGVEVPARIWQGTTETGIPVQCFITRIAPEVEIDHPRHRELLADFQRELMECATPRPPVEAIPLRLIV